MKCISWLYSLSISHFQSYKKPLLVQMFVGYVWFRVAWNETLNLSGNFEIVSLLSWLYVEQSMTCNLKTGMHQKKATIKMWQRKDVGNHGKELGHFKVIKAKQSVQLIP